MDGTEEIEKSKGHGWYFYALILAMLAGAFAGWWTNR